MSDNPMKILYRLFGEKPQEGQSMLSVANIFYLMGQEQEEKNKQSEKEKLIKELLGGLDGGCEKKVDQRGR